MAKKKAPPLNAASIQVAGPVPVALRNHIFVSSAQEDRQITDTVIKALEALGHSCWVAHRDIVPGISWAGAIVSAITASGLMIVIVSRHSVTSRQVLREITIADDEGVPFLPLRVDGIQLSPDFRYYFSASQQLDVSQVSQLQGIQMVSSAVAARLGK